MGHSPAIFPIGNPDVSAQNLSPDFVAWLNAGLNKALARHKRTTPIIKLWHLQGSFESYSNRQILLSFYELDNPTLEEVNTVKNNDKVFFSSAFSAKHFQALGCKNVEAIPMGFDKHNFFITGKKYFSDGRVTFNLVGKLEKRKHHLQVLKAWANKYGNNPKYALNCAIVNPFMDIEQQKQAIGQTLGAKYYNISFQGFLPTNLAYNDYLNSADIVIGMSGGEGWGLPEFQSVAMGKHSVILNCAGYQDWATEANSVLVQPCGKEEAYDNVFFRKGGPFNQGNIFQFDDAEFIEGCEKAIARAKVGMNYEGVKLQQMTYKTTVEKLLSAI